MGGAARAGSAEVDPGDLPDALVAFCAERHLATLTTLRADGSPHVVPVGFTLEPGARLVRVITRRRSAKARHAAQRGRAVVCSVDGGRWVTLEGTVRVSDDAEEVADAVARYAERYGRTPAPNPERVALLVTLDRVLAGVALRRGDDVSRG